jgi:branched-chain amino acid transport system substrate-binding protein
MGSARARVHTWDGSKFTWSSNFIDADESIITPMVKASADRYAAEKKLTRRPASDCNS